MLITCKILSKQSLYIDLTIMPNRHRNQMFLSGVATLTIEPLTQHIRSIMAIVKNVANSFIKLVVFIYLFIYCRFSRPKYGMLSPCTHTQEPTLRSNIIY